MAYKTTASLDKLTCTNYVDFGTFQDKFGNFSWSENDPNYLDVKHKVFKKDDKKIPTGPKTYNETGNFQPVYASEDSASHCSSRLRWRGKRVLSADTYKVQRHR